MILRCLCLWHQQNQKTIYYRESWQDGAYRRKTRYVVLGLICLTCNQLVLEGDRNAQAALPETQ